MTHLVDEAVDALERRLFFDEFTTRFDELRGDADAWSGVEAERDAEHGALGDSSS